MRSSVRLGAAAVAVLCAVLFFLWSTREGAPSLPGELAAETPEIPATPEVIAGAPSRPPDAERSPVAEPAAEIEAPVVVDAELEHPYLYFLAVRTVDENGFPKSVEELRLAPACSSLNDARAFSCTGGWSTFVWRGKQPEMDVDVQIAGGTSLQESRRVHVRAGSPCQVALLSEADQGHSFTSASFTLALVTSGESIQQIRLDRVLAFEANLRMERFPHPHARFGDHFVGVVAAEPEVAAAPPPMDAQLQAVGKMIELRLLEDEVRNVEFVRSAVLKMHVQGQLDLAFTPPSGSRVTIRVVDERGEPVSGELVAFGRALDGRELATQTDSNGDAVLEEVESGWWEARAGGGPAGLVRERIHVEAPNPLNWVAQLDRGSRVVGRVQKADGNPALNVLVRWESTPGMIVRASTVRMVSETRGGEELAESGDPAAASSDWRAPWIDQVWTRDDGMFEFANVPPGLGRLTVWLSLSEAGPVLVEEGVFPSPVERVLRLPAENGGMLLVVQAPPLAEAPPVQVRAISEATGIGSNFAGDPSLGFASQALAPGWYRVEVGAAWCGWHDLGRFLVEPGPRVDLGSFALPAPATVRVLTPDPLPTCEGGLGLTFYLRRPDLDLRGEPRAAPGGGALLMPAGDYWVFWNAADGSLRRRALSLGAGANVELDLRSE